MLASVWEWNSDNDCWLPYSAPVSHLLERIHSRGLVSACLGDADPELVLFTVHLNSLQQRNTQTGKVNAVRRMTYPDSVCCSGLSWQWADSMPETWHLYEMTVQDVIEVAFQTRTAELNLHEKFSHLPFIISFQAMTQTSRTSGFTRSVRRFQGAPYPLIKKPRQQRTNSLRERSVVVSEQNVQEKKATALHRTQSTRTPSNANRAPTCSYLLRTRSFSGAANAREMPSKHSLPAAAPNAGNTVETKSKKIKASVTQPSTTSDSSSSSGGGMTLLQKLVSPVRVIANLLAPSQRGKKSKKNKASDLPVFMPGPQPLQVEHLQPVQGVKLPSEICMVDKSSSVTKSVEEMLHEYTKLLDTVPDGEDCSICCECLTVPSAYDDDSSIISLCRCSHVFHKSCIVAMYKSNNTGGFIQCPTCKIIYGVKVGNQPPGRMEYVVLPYSLPGYPTCNSIAITYQIPTGTQGPEHPNPGKPYTTRGFPRRGYLPDNEEGRKVLKLLITAWERRLIFTIGTSATTGEEGTVTWNEIHHKTEFGSNYSGHGFPDPGYLQNLLQELALQGVTASS